MASISKFIAIIPAAGVGKRMQANCPKQYLCINNQTILTHTVTKLLTHPLISQVVIVLGANDEYFAQSPLAHHPDIIRVTGGTERVNSVLNGLKAVNAEQYPWVLVHDAARPCVSHQDIDNLIAQCLANNHGGILATPVRDTMKRGVFVKDAKSNVSKSINLIDNTVEREQLWHALTPQLYKTNELRFAIEQALANGVAITDEASAIEQANLPSLLVSASSENIKITHPNDLALAEFYLAKQAEQLNKSTAPK
ncbi:2-C-methyl-D-erythritol 4-phosphate cytidylyltransferase [Colwellia ponticola]|uniref:2-C-methyl-D-erythritol 4-phosphate cytidylyltransferase n=1 Tax=Colwellia ponticola TaxID=2304625 RepID=A0A8H2JLT3_9GAMM|nr:2-C-methyl-D-erythritol 4-phosphate cytidylyltransferase [Colwellia ponticola]TMM46032.1 2-C-methyl-D-erythritol 4-phosphate cytidylyltransferase [Colwellia ponticola]